MNESRLDEELHRRQERIKDMELRLANQRSQLADLEAKFKAGTELLEACRERLESASRKQHWAAGHNKFAENLRWDHCKQNPCGDDRKLLARLDERLGAVSDLTPSPSPVHDTRKQVK